MWARPNTISRFTVLLTLGTVDCVMKGSNYRKTTARECKDTYCVIKKEGCADFAVCVFDGIGRYNGQRGETAVEEGRRWRHSARRC